ncbi:MAG: hypothetical protein JW388_0978 [Nitrospira sp.]|nr:hypothetical protein [Nitrospira sp.]
MKKIETTVFRFNELNDKAKEKAREWFRRASDGDDFWSECALEEVEREGILLGISFKERQRTSMSGKPLPGKPCIWWSGFWSQGDGACFEGTWSASDVKADKVADGWGEYPATTEIKRIAAVFEEIAKEYPESSFTVTHRGHYNHENCTEFDFNFPDDKAGEEWPEDKREAWDKECENLKENAKDFMRWIYRRLEKEYEHANSDEQVDENIMANEYPFTDKGERTVIL